MTNRNILCDPLPDRIRVCGEEFGINTDFRRWILVIEAFEDRDIPDTFTKIRCAVMLVCPELWRRMRGGERFSVHFWEELTSELLTFASCGKALSSQRGHIHSESEKVFDFEQDGDVIFSSFFETYAIDLTVCRMHWWKFSALLGNLPPESGFMRLAELRLCDTSKIENDSLRRRVRRAKAAVRIR